MIGLVATARTARLTLAVRRLYVNSVNPRVSRFTTDLSP